MHVWSDLTCIHRVTELSMRAMFHGDNKLNTDQLGLALAVRSIQILSLYLLAYEMPTFNLTFLSTLVYTCAWRYN